MHELEQPDEFTKKQVKAELLENKRHVYNLLLSQASTIRKLGLLATAYPLAMDLIWSSEINSLAAPERLGVHGSALLIAVGSGAISEKRRRGILQAARQEAEDVVSQSRQYPTVPTPNWAKRAIGVELE